MPLRLKDLQLLLDEATARQFETQSCGLISLLDNFGYFYFVPLTDQFYKNPRFQIPEIKSQQLGDQDLSIPDNPIFSAVNFGWLPIVAEAVKRENLGRIGFIDIGAFVGSVAVHVASHRDSREWEISAYEPNPDNHALLSLNFSLNKLPPIRLHNAAVTIEGGDVTFQVPHNARISGRVSDISVGYADAQTVRSSSIRDVVLTASDTNDWLVIKIDTEGYESRLMPALTALHAKNILCVLCEYWPTKDGVLEAHLVEHYGLYLMGSVQFAQSPPYQRLDTTELLRSTVQAHIDARGSCDIVCVPRTLPPEMFLRMDEALGSNREQLRGAP